MAGEIWLALAAACVGCLAWRGPGWVRRLRYEPHHTGELKRVEAEHQGATEEWSPMRDVGKPPPIDARVQLANCEAQIQHWQRAAEQLRAQIAAEDLEPLRRALADMERNFRDRLSRTGRAVHLEADTAEFRRSDIRPRSLVRSGAPR